MTKPTITSEELDELFDNGGDITPYVVEGSERFPNREVETRKINISMPLWLVDEIDEDARHLGNTRQGLINMWLAECVRRERERTERTA